MQKVKQQQAVAAYMAITHKLSQGKKGTNFPMTDWGLFANSVMRGRVHARRTLKGLVAYLRMTIFSLS